MRRNFLTPPTTKLIVMNKKTFRASKKKAFSLIELSIVLIIIGLLIAGVTGGSSLIKNAELRKITEEARGYQTVVNSFYSKYNALPGDFNVAIGAQTGTATGNNDGAISFVSQVTGPGGKMEGNIAWQMLKNDNFITDAFTPASADATTTTTYTTQLTGGTNIPASKSQGGGWAFDNITIADGTTRNVVVIFAGSTPAGVGTMTAATAYAMTTTPTPAIAAATAAATTNNAHFIPTDALSIDSKIDDGIPTSGKVTSLLNHTTANCSDTTTTPDTYITTTTYKACALAFQVDPNS